MLKNTQETALNTVEVTIVIEREKFEKALLDAYKKEVKKIQIPGFRKGKAPKAIIEKMYGKGVFYEPALNAIAPAEADAAIAECGFKPVSAPQISDVDFESEEGIVVKVTFTRRPDVKLGSYKGIEAVRTTVKVEDEQVDAELEKIRKRYARTTEITDRPAENGDITTIDYEGFVDGVPFDGGKAKDHKLTLGSGEFIPGFEEQIIGKSVSEEAFEVNVKFPDDYHAEELKGKDAQFKVVLHKIEKEELPTIDDEFAKDASEFATLAEYKADIKAKMEKKNADDADRKLSVDISEELAKLVEAEIPQVMFDKEVELLVREYDLNLRQQGLSLDMLVQYTGMTLDTIKEQYKSVAEVNVKKNLALEEIIKAEDIKATDEDVEKRYEEIAKAYNMKVEEVKNSLPTENLEEEVQSIKAFDLVKAAAKITDRSVTEQELQAEELAKAEVENAKAAKAESNDESEDAEEKAAPKKKVAKKKKSESNAEKENSADAE